MPWIVEFHERKSSVTNLKIMIKKNIQNPKEIWTIIRLSWATDSTQNKRQFDCQPASVDCIGFWWIKNGKNNWNDFEHSYFWLTLFSIDLDRVEVP